MKKISILIPCYNEEENVREISAALKMCIRDRCVTSGPGAINALNGVAGAYQDSIPMIVVSGQTKTSLMTINSGLDLRTLGNQEFDIMSALSKMTKYAETLMNPNNVRYILEKAFYLAKNGRPGPCWIEVPDVYKRQGYMVLNPEIFDYIDGDDTVFEKEPLVKLSEQGELMSYMHKGFWQCMDNKREMDLLEKL